MKLVGLPSLVAGCCEIEKVYPRKVCKCAYTCISYAKTYHFPANFASKVLLGFSIRYTFIYTFAGFVTLYFSILQHFGAKLGNFAGFKMLFLAVVKEFIRLVSIGAI